MNKKISVILLSIVALILIAVNIVIYINNHKSEVDEATNNELIAQNIIENTAVNNEQEVKDAISSRVATLPEKNRMQIYFGEFIEYIEQNDYENAYALLNGSFKDTYFPTIDDFKKYVEKYPKNMVVDYQDLERQGELYVLTVEIQDAFDKKVETITQRVVIRENGTDNFTLSFQIDEDED